MATQDSPNLLTRGLHTGPYGNGVSHSGSFVTAALANGDILRLVKLPAGTKVDALICQHDQVDSNGTPTLTAKIGFTPVNASDGPTANDAYWFASAAWGRTKASILCAAQPIQFEFDVFVIITITAAIATLVTTANVSVVANGITLGLK